MRTSIAVVSATRKPPVMKNEDDEADEIDYSKPPAKVKRDAFSYVASGKTAPGKGCKACFFYDKPHGECELVEILNEDQPGVFALDENVADNAGCAGHIAKKKEI